MRRVVVAGLILLVVAAIGCGVGRWPRATECRTFGSPDGRFQVTVYRTPIFFAAPGQASDAPGFFRLRDTRIGRTLREQKVAMVQLVERVEWTDTTVTVGLLAEWRLPR